MSIFRRRFHKFTQHSTSNEQCSKPKGWLFDIGDDKLPNYIGIIISQYKDPYLPISIMECHWRVFNAAQIMFKRRIAKSASQSNSSLAFILIWGLYRRYSRLFLLYNIYIVYIYIYIVIGYMECDSKDFCRIPHEHPLNTYSLGIQSPSENGNGA